MRKLAFFAHDSTESTVVKRAEAFQANGARVTGFMFRRRGRPERPMSWENIPLGVTDDRNYLARLPKLLWGVLKVLRHARQLRQCSVLYARNIDMLFIAVLTKLLTGARGIVVYELLDIRGVFLGKGLVNRLFRWAERRLMAACHLVVVSAPDYVTHYLHAVQGYRGACFLMENKLSARTLPPPSAAPAEPLPPGPPWIVGMYGVLRCRRSLDILCEVARRLPDKSSIYLRGVVSETDIPLDELVTLSQRIPNVTYGGAYSSPRDLPEIYGKAHFIWALDFLAVGGNSEWCLANRIYEGGAMGTVLLAEAGNATGRMVEREGLGFTLERDPKSGSQFSEKSSLLATEPFADALATFLEDMTPEKYEAARQRLKGVKRSVFVDEIDTAELLKTLDELWEAENIKHLKSVVA
ncbi:MAG: glucosyl transferase [Alphaproteobacteria bacterium]